MKKPTTILIQEFRKDIEDTINNSKLPFWKILDELQYIVLPQVKQCAIQEEQSELQEWQKSVEEEEKQKLEELRESRVSESEVDNNG